MREGHFGRESSQRNPEWPQDERVSPVPEIPRFSRGQVSIREILLAAGIAGGLALPDAAFAKASETPEQSKARVEAAFQWEISADERQILVEDVGEEHVAEYERVVRTFPIEQYVQEIAKFSGVSEDTLWVNLDLEHIFPYSVRTLEENAEEHIKSYAPEVSWDHETNHAIAQSEAFAGTGGVTLQNDQAIGINLQKLHEVVEQTALVGGMTKQEADLMFSVYLEHAIGHEIGHAIDEFNRDEAQTPVEMQLYEGLIDAIACQALEQLPTAYEKYIEKYPLFTGYTSGVKQAGRFLLSSLDAHSTMNAVLTGSIRDIERKFDEKYGDRAWETVTHFAPSLPEDVHTEIQAITPLYALMKMTASHDARSVIEKMNTQWPRAGILPIVQDSTLVGVAVRDFDTDVLINGVAFLKLDDGSTLTLTHATNKKPVQFKESDGSQAWFAGTMIDNTKGLSNEEVTRKINDKVNFALAYTEGQK